MKISVDEYRFRKEFEVYGRDDQFSSDALDALYGWYEDMDPNMELDVVAICCDWTEYDADELNDEFDKLLDKDEKYETPEERWDALLTAIEDETTVIKIDDYSYLVMAY